MQIATRTRTRTRTRMGPRRMPSASRVTVSPLAATYLLTPQKTNSGNQHEGGKSGGDDDNGKGDDDNGKGDDEDDNEDDEDEDDTAELFRELEKIKRERAAEKARAEEAEAAVTESEREARIATANPLLNLAAALGTAPGINTTAPGTFSVKRRWDDGALHLLRGDDETNRLTLTLLTHADLIFKNQAASEKDKPPGQFVNDLLRTEFHK